MVATSSLFLQELDRFGPDSAGVTCSLEEADQYCRRLSQTHYENFRVASWFLPKKLHQDFATLYSFCRWSDDLADEVGDQQKSLQLLGWWQQQLRLCYNGCPTHPVMVSLQQTIVRHKMPIEPFEDLLSAFRQDQHRSRYGTQQELLDYCSRSANPVGRMVLRFADADDAENIALSNAICTGLQLANICQDMSIDAGKDRIYVPAELQAKYGVTEPMILARQPVPQLKAMLKQCVALTKAYFLDGWRLVDRVPDWLRVDVDLFVRGGLAILAEIEGCGFDVWSQRPKVSKTFQAKLFMQAALGKFAGRLIGKRLHREH